MSHPSQARNTSIHTRSIRELTLIVRLSALMLLTSAAVTFFVSPVSMNDFGGRTSVNAATNSPGSVITTCQDITAPGNYSLASDLVESQANTACLRIKDTHDVHLDCKFNAIKGGTGNGAPAISVTNVQGFSITRCTLQTETGWVLTVNNSSDGDLVRNTIGNLTDQQQFFILFDSVHNTRIVHNTINAVFQQVYSSGNLLRFNLATCPIWTNNSSCSGLLISILGSNNTMDRNEIDGKGSISTGQNGADDGVILSDESGDVVSNNIIRNTWDAGIETVGNITDTEISSNSLTNVGIGGIGGWYWNSWRNVTVTDNTVRGVRFLFYFFRIFGLRPANWDGRGVQADTGVYFQENLFSRNQLIDGSDPASPSAYIPIYDYLNYNGGVSGLPGERPAQISDFQLNDNTFTRNDFGHIELAPYFAEPFTVGKIIDGGRNICSNPGANYPLVCH
ncbi:MAG TPA: right-handed parallel beta-helix repeat-containing protein [Pyrinomonadaceae bacterium]|nr:right-handed parallel beta-helix repeat-containing protein [Pyrinomonadaceae bacterium]